MEVGGRTGNLVASEKTGRWWDAVYYEVFEHECRKRENPVFLNPTPAYKNESAAYHVTEEIEERKSKKEQLIFTGTMLH